MKVESVILAVLALCIFLSFYFTYLSFQTIDDALKKQFVVLAASSLITGVVIFACMTIYLGIKRALPCIEDQLTSAEELMEKDNVLVVSKERQKKRNGLTRKSVFLY